MKYILTIALAVFSLIASAQDINFKLAGAHEKKWIGDNTNSSSTTENNTTLTFYKNRSVVEFNTKTKKAKPAQHWQIVEGQYRDDAKIILMIGSKEYKVEFLSTSNGRDFMTLSSGDGGDAGEYVEKSYHAE